MSERKLKTPIDHAKWLIENVPILSDAIARSAGIVAKALLDQRDDIKKLTKALQATMGCLKFDIGDVQEILEDNAALRERDTEVRKRAETLVATIQSEGGMKFEASCCNYCKESWTTILGATREECSARAREHDLVCTANPVVLERDRLQAQLIDTQDALWKACSLATTHRAEDREEIRTLAKLGQPRK